MIDILIKATSDTIMGMGTVFVVLIFISFLISLFKYIPALEAKFSKKNEQPAPVQKQAPAAAAEEEEEEEELVDDAELVAVITAAIMASRQNANAISADKLVVKSIRRVGRRV